MLSIKKFEDKRDIIIIIHIEQQSRRFSHASTVERALAIAYPQASILFNELYRLTNSGPLAAHKFSIIKHRLFDLAPNEISKVRRRIPYNFTSQ